MKTEHTNSLSKTIAGSLALTVIIALCGCSSSGSNNASGETSSTVTTTQETTTESLREPYLKEMKYIFYDNNENIKSTIIFEYDEYGNEIKLTEIRSDNSKTEYESKYEYNEKKQIIKCTSYENGKNISQSEYQYNEHGDIKEISTYVHDIINNKPQLISKEENIYDENYHLIRKNSTYYNHGEYKEYIIYNYDDKGNQLSRCTYEVNNDGGEDLLISIEKYEYNAEGYKIKHTESDESEEVKYEYEYEYNSKGQLIKQIDTIRKTVNEYDYDDKGDVVKIISYDKDGNFLDKTLFEYTYA